ncbi:MAG: hypothetical protein AB7F86_18235 [Bdellovibrionales bacterium]
MEDIKVLSRPAPVTAGVAPTTPPLPPRKPATPPSSTPPATTDVGPQLLQSCQQGLSDAQSGCRSLLSQSTNPQTVDASSLAKACDEYKRTNDAVVITNNNNSATCTNLVSQCRSLCADSGTTAGKTNSKQREIATALHSCVQLENQVRQVASQSQQSLSASYLAQRCTQAAAADPQSTPPSTQKPNDNKTGPTAGGGSPSPTGGGGGGGGGDSGGSGYSDPSSYNSASTNSRYDTNNCDVDPSAPGCKSEKEVPTGKSGFGNTADGSPKASDFNINTPSAGTQQPYEQSGAGTNNKGGQQNGTVSNNSGGSFGGGDSNPAKLDNDRRGGGPGSPGYSTDILQGYQGASGGYNPSSGNYYGNSDDSNQYGGARRPAADAGPGMDLRQYLPGGRRMAGYRMVAGKFVHGEGIHGPGTNLFERISVRFTEKCRLGLLYDCR